MRSNIEPVSSYDASRCDIQMSFRDSNLTHCPMNDTFLKSQASKCEGVRLHVTDIDDGR